MATTLRLLPRRGRCGRLLCGTRLWTIPAALLLLGCRAALGVEASHAPLPPPGEQATVAATPANADVGGVAPLTWHAMLERATCHDQRAALAEWLHRSDLAEHAWGAWMLCAVAHGDRTTARIAADRLVQGDVALPEWSQAALWVRWWIDPVSAPVPATPAAAWLDAPLWPRLLAAIAEAPHAPWAQAAYVVLAGDPRWPAPTRRLLADAMAAERRLDTAQVLVRVGQRAAAWDVLAPRWRNAAPSVGAIAAWWPDASAGQLAWFADLAFGLREYDAARDVAALLARRHNDGQGWLIWGRALARMHRASEARDVWREALAKRGTDVWAVRIAYRMGLLAEDEGDVAGAVSWYMRAAAMPVAHEERDEAAFRAGWLAYRAGDGVAARTRWATAAPRAVDVVAARRLYYWSWVAGDRSALVRLAREAPLSYYAWLSTLRGAATPLTYVTWLPLAPAPPSVAARLQTADTLAALGFAPPAAALAARLLPELPTAPAAALVLDRMQRYGDTEAAMRAFWQSALAAEFRADTPNLNHDVFALQYPRPFSALVTAAATRFGVDPYLIWAVMREESHFAPRSVSVAGAMGLAQLMPATAQLVAARNGLPYNKSGDLVDPAVNIPIAAAYLAELQRRYNGDLFAQIAAYNAGEGAVDRWRHASESARDAWVEDIPYSETRRYVIKVMRSYIRYRALYAQQLPDARLELATVQP